MQPHFLRAIREGLHLLPAEEELTFILDNFDVAAHPGGGLFEDGVTFRPPAGQN